MNNKGITILYKLMVAMTVIILGIALSSPAKSLMDLPLSDLTCTAPANDFDQATCWTIDIMKFLLIGGIIGIGLYLIWKIP